MKHRFEYQFDRGHNTVLTGKIPADAEFPDEYLLDVIKAEGVGFNFTHLLIFRPHDNGIDRDLIGDVMLIDQVPGNNWALSFGDHDIDEWLDLDFAIEKLFREIED